MNDFCRKRGTERSSQLLSRFNDRSLPRIPFQNEKKFSFQVKNNRQNNRVYIKGRVESMMLSQDNYSMKKTSFPELMVSAGITE